LPKCRVLLVCGPPASGKSTLVRARAGPDDVVVDLDAIAREFGFGRDRPAEITAELLQERNRRLAALAAEPPSRTAWVILGAPSPSLRQWWCDALGVEPADLILLTPPRDELRRRIWADPDRVAVRLHHLALVDKWLDRERVDNPGIVKSGCDASGYPLDPLHPANRRERAERF
jgi:5-methylcytosine-specific restriction protein A